MNTTTTNRFAPFNLIESEVLHDGLKILLCQPDLPERRTIATCLVGEIAPHADALRQREEEARQRTEAYRERLETEALQLLLANGFSAEVGGGGCTIMSLYLPNGAYIWATNEEGGGGITATEFCLCVYHPVFAQEGYEPLTDLRPSDVSFLTDAVRMSLAAARTVDAALASGATYSHEVFRDVATDAAEAVRDRFAAEIIPEGFRRWTDGIAQGGAVFAREGVGYVLLTDMTGQEYATAESWLVSVITGDFPWDGDSDSETGHFLHEIKMADGLTLDAALAGALAMLNALPESGK